MMRARSLLLGAALLFGVALPVAGRAQTSSQATPQPPESAVVQLAQQMWRQAADQGVNFDNGPCLGTITQGWVADVVHVPRSQVDNLPQNQCEAYRNGTAQHFVELDTHGDVVQVH